MPTYEYACRSCGDHLEVVQSFKDDPLTVCPSCQGELRKVFSPIGIAFKGSGFYKTDSRPGSKKAPASAAAGSGTSESSSAKADGPAKTDSAGKTESAGKTDGPGKTTSSAKTDSSSSSPSAAAS